MEQIKKKMATLKHEQEEAEQRAIAVEDKLNDMATKVTEKSEEKNKLEDWLAELEDELDKQETELAKVEGELARKEKTADEAHRVQRVCCCYEVLENRGKSDTSRLVSYQQRLQSKKRSLGDSQTVYKELGQRLNKLDREQEELEDTIVEADEKRRDLENDINIIGNQLRALETSQSASRPKQDQFSDKEEMLKALVLENEEMGKHVELLRLTLSEMEERLEQEKIQYENAKSEFDTTLSELADL